MKIALNQKELSYMDIKYPFVSIVVVTKNEERHIKDCLESLMRLEYPKEKHEIIVVDGNSTDKTREIVKEYLAKLIIDKEGGLANSRNIGIQAAKGDYIASTDADCVVKKDWLKILVKSIQEAPEDVVAVGGPNLIFKNDPPFAKLVGYMQETFFASGGAPQSYKINESKYVFSIHNCNILYKKNILIEEGGFDENFNVGEDAELNFRLRQKGYKFLYLPDVIVWHRRPDNLKKFIKKMFLYGESMAKITRKHKKIVRWYAFLPTFAMFALLIAYPLIKLFPFAAYMYMCGIFIYMMGLVISTAQVYRSYGGIKSLLVLLLLPIQHLSYGVGFLKGIIRG